MIRALVAGMLGWALLCCPAGSPSAVSATAQDDPVVDPVFDPEDAQDLADLLADASRAQGVCYGWTVRVHDQDTGTDQQSVGSNIGPRQSPADTGRAVEAGGPCRSRVEFTADIVYTAASSDSADSASWSVISIPAGPGTGDLDRLGLFDENDLTGETVDAAVARAVAALPQLAADAGIAAPLTAAPAGSTPPDIGSLADDPGSDYLRRAGGLLALGTVLLAGGVLFGVFALRSSRSDSRARPETSPRRPSPQPPPSSQQ